MKRSKICGKIVSDQEGTEYHLIGVVLAFKYLENLIFVLPLFHFERGITMTILSGDNYVLYLESGRMVLRYYNSVYFMVRTDLGIIILATNHDGKRNHVKPKINRMLELIGEQTLKRNVRIKNGYNYFFNGNEIGCTDFKGQHILPITIDEIDFWEEFI